MRGFIKLKVFCEYHLNIFENHQSSNQIIKFDNVIYCVYYLDALKGQFGRCSGLPLEIKKNI